MGEEGSTLAEGEVLILQLKFRMYSRTTINIYTVSLDGAWYIEQY